MKGKKRRIRGSGAREEEKIERRGKENGITRGKRRLRGEARGMGTRKGKRRKEDDRGRGNK